MLGLESRLTAYLLGGLLTLIIFGAVLNLIKKHTHEKHA
jgi:glycopeptide antibiotics resistance protein